MAGDATEFDDPDLPTAGWLQAEKDADLTLWLPGGEGREEVPMFFRKVPPDDWMEGKPEVERLRFRMGARGYYPDEEPVHEVQLAAAFYMATFPVTQAQYRGVAELCGELENAQPSHIKGEFRPVEEVTWHDAQAWLDWVLKNGGALRLVDSEEMDRELVELRLPSEAEWEYACRAGTETEYCSGDGEAALQEVGWFGEFFGMETRAVGGKLANAFGLYDLHGNVLEWCRDGWDEEAYAKRVDGVIDPYEAPVSEDDDKPRVLRGGSWNNSARDCRSAFRFWRWAGFRNGNNGFRVGLFPGPVKSQ